MLSTFASMVQMVLTVMAGMGLWCSLEMTIFFSKGWSRIRQRIMVLQERKGVGDINNTSEDDFYTGLEGLRNIYVCLTLMSCLEASQMAVFASGYVMSPLGGSGGLPCSIIGAVGQFSLLSYFAPVCLLSFWTYYVESTLDDPFQVHVHFIIRTFDSFLASLDPLVIILLWMAGNVAFSAVSVAMGWILPDLYGVCGNMSWSYPFILRVGFVVPLVAVGLTFVIFYFLRTTLKSPSKALPPVQPPSTFPSLASGATSTRYGTAGGKQGRYHAVPAPASINNDGDSVSTAEDELLPRSDPPSNQLYTALVLLTIVCVIVPAANFVAFWLIFSNCQRADTCGDGPLFILMSACNLACFTILPILSYVLRRVLYPVNLTEYLSLSQPML
eukprot:TRINITY_DN7061_c0_g1_i1.p1 TRINITY_DN7061_c0_g1~~TRINITY_DN7061_c0_g1_i1.p1  ORF type:complete len:386 (+),score=41.15 TRINITY_DN7061_c0_g1_i1:374-1531(+)